MKALLPVLLIAAAAATTAHAECNAPSTDVKIPDGNTASMDDMLAAKKVRLPKGCGPSWDPIRRPRSSPAAN